MSRRSPHSVPSWGHRQQVDRNGIRYRIEDVISVPQGEHKMIVLQRIQHALPAERLEFRFAYYRHELEGENSTGARRWMFGQSALFIPLPELTQLLSQAASRRPEFAAAIVAASKVC